MLESLGNLIYQSTTYPYSPAVLVVLSLWSVFWKGMSLWKSSRNEQKYWFIALLILNTVGILDILYISFFQRKKK